MAELLRISIKLSDKEQLHNAALQESEVGLSEDDKNWLIEAMDVRGKSDADRMKEALTIINNAEEPQSHKEYALDLILWFIEDIDSANDFVRFEDGLATLLRLLRAEVPVLRLGAAWIMGALVQNNEKAQAAVLAATGAEGGSPVAVPVLAELVLTDAEVEVRRKALLALSGIARNSEPGQAAFLAAGGPALLATVLSEPAPDAALCRRALFLAGHLVREAPATFAELLGKAADSSLVPACVELLGSESTREGEPDLEEQALVLLQALAEVEAGIVSAAEGMGAALRARQAAIGRLPAEEQEYCEVETGLLGSLLKLSV